MKIALQQTELYERLNHQNNPAFIYLKDERLQKDVWEIRKDLPLLAEQAHIASVKTINFELICLPWLKDLTKLAVLAAVSSRQWGLRRVTSTVSSTGKFSVWLLSQGYVTPSILTVQVIQQWLEHRNGRGGKLDGLLRVLKDLGCIQFQVNWSQSHKYSKNQQVIPEYIKYKIDLALEELEKPVYTAFKLHEALGTRSIEIAKIPLNCLRQYEGVPQVLVPTGKQRDSKKIQDLPEELVPLVHQQQAFVRRKFGDDFPWLFPNWAQKLHERPSILKFEYHREQLKSVNEKFNGLLKKLIESNDIRNEDGSLAHVTTHMFRRTYATIADRMGKSPDQIQHGLRHANSYMQDFYVYVPPKEQGKRTERVLVDKDGKRIIFHTDRDREILRKEWVVRQVETGVCTRPSIIQDCEYEYICLSCKYSRYAPEHLPQLLQVRQVNQNLLERCLKEGKADSRRAHSARQIINILNHIIDELKKAEKEEVF